MINLCAANPSLVNANYMTAGSCSPCEIEIDAACAFPGTASCPSFSVPFLFGLVAFVPDQNQW